MKKKMYSTYKHITTPNSLRGSRESLYIYTASDQSDRGDRLVRQVVSDPDYAVTEPGFDSDRDS